jgi:hypothetical protein
MPVGVSRLAKSEESCPFRDPNTWCSMDIPMEAIGPTRWTNESFAQVKYAGMRE